MAVKASVSSCGADSCARSVSRATPRKRWACAIISRMSLPDATCALSTCTVFAVTPRKDSTALVSLHSIQVPTFRLRRAGTDEPERWFEPTWPTTVFL